MKTILAGLMLILQFWIVTASLGQSNPAEVRQQTDSLARLYFYLEEKHDYQAEHLLFNYVAKLGSEGEIDLLVLVTLYHMRPRQARQVFDCLLNSQNHELVADALDELTVQYTYICKAKQIKKVKFLTMSEDEKIRTSAIHFLRVIEEGESAKRKAREEKGVRAYY